MASTDLGKVKALPKGTWSNSATYEKLDIVSKDGSSYIALQDVPAGTAVTNTSYWQLLAEKGEPGDTGAVPAFTIGTVATGEAGSSAAASITGTDEEPVLNLTIPQGLKGDAGNGDMIADDFSTSKAYAAGEYVIYNGHLYRFTAAHAAGAWSGSDATEVQLVEDVTDLKNTLSEITEPSINLFDPFDVETGFYLDSRGDQASDANSQTTGYILVTAGETYINTSLDGSYYMCTYNSSKVFIERINAYYASTRTFGNNVAYIRISYYQHSFPANFMLVEGTALPTEYIPHVAIKKVVLPEDVKATTELLVESPNLFDISAKTHGKYQTAAGGLKNETDSEISDYILVEYGKKYCFSSLPPSWYWYIGTFTADRTFIERLNAYQSDNPFQFGSTVAYIRISIYQHSFPSDYMALNSDTLPQAFYPYGYIANNDLIIADNGKVKVTKLDSANYIVRTGKGTHTLTHDIENIKNLNTWRLTQATVTGKELWHDVDVEGPIKQKDVSDYMTGYHGDEQFTVLSVLVDGVETDLDEVEVGSIIECSNFTVCVTSDVYFDGSTINKAFVRCKRLVFDGNTLKIFNTYKYIANDPIQIDISTGTGLYPVKSTVVTSYTTNTGNTIVSEETTNRNDMLDSVSFFGDGFVINLHVLFGKTNGYFGVVYYLPEQTRYKVYFYQHYTTGTNYLTLNNGDELCSGYEIEFI